MPETQAQAPEAQASGQGAPDLFLSQAKELFGHEFSSMDEVKNQWSELNSYKSKYEEFTGKFGELEQKAKLADEYESHPLVPQFKEFMKNLDPSDPAKALQQVSEFTKLHVTDWDGLAKNDPISVLVEKEFIENEGELTRAQIERALRKQYKLDPSQYDDLDEEDAEEEAKMAKAIAVREAKKAADFFKSKKADFSKHPAHGAKEQQQRQAEEFAKLYTAAVKEAASSLKELDFGGFKYKVDGEPGEYTKAAFESPNSFIKSLVLDEKGANYDPGKIMKLALMMDHVDNMLKAAAGTAKADGIKEVLNDASRTTPPGQKPFTGDGHKPLSQTPFLKM